MATIAISWVLSTVTSVFLIFLAFVIRNNLSKQRTTTTTTTTKSHTARQWHTFSTTVM